MTLRFQRLDKQIFQCIPCVSLCDSVTGGKITFSYRYTTRSIYTPMPEDSRFFQTWPAGQGWLEFHCVSFLLQQSSMAMKNPPFLDVFTHIYRMYSISMYFLLESKLFSRLDESVMPFFHPINCHRISPFNEKVRIPMPSKILNFFKICPALVLLPRPSTSSHPKCGYLHGVWEIPQKRCCLIK